MRLSKIRDWQAGPELDRAIARYLMHGIEADPAPRFSTHSRHIPWLLEEITLLAEITISYRSELDRPSGHYKREYLVTIQDYDDRYDEVDAVAPKLPLAICLAVTEWFEATEEDTQQYPVIAPRSPSRDGATSTGGNTP